MYSLKDEIAIVKENEIEIKFYSDFDFDLDNNKN
jgi:hypothetical protein